MIGHLLIAALKQDPSQDVLYIAVGLFILMGLGVGALVLRDVRHRGRQKQRELQVQEGQLKQQELQRQREQEAYKRHLEVNELTAQKIRLECRVLEAQTESAEHAKAKRARDDAYHALAMQKIQLEIQGLKLHIKEQKKRNEDFTSYDDEE